MNVSILAIAAGVWAMAGLTLEGQDTSGQAHDLIGVWQSPTGTVRINADGTATMGAKTHRYTVSSNVITFTGNGEPIRIPYELSGNTWIWKFGGGQMTLTRTTAPPANTPSHGSGISGATAAASSDGIVGSWHAPNTPLEIRADGTAVFNGTTYQYTQSGNILTLTGPDGTYLANMQLTGDKMTWQLAGKTFNFSRVGSSGSSAGPTDTAARQAAPDAGLIGSWQSSNTSLQIKTDGTAVLNGVTYQYTQSGDMMTLKGPDGTYLANVQLAGDRMTWQLAGKTFNFTRAGSSSSLAGSTGASKPGEGTVRQELVGTWCKSTYINNTAAAGGNGAHSYGRSECFTLQPNGSYHYEHEFDATGQAYGSPYGTASASSDNGTWTATDTNITANSTKTGVHVYRLEKRNNKNGDPLLVLDGVEFYTKYQKASWR